jgi:pilus assembly protein Flp/PilA
MPTKIEMTRDVEKESCEMKMNVLRTLQLLHKDESGQDLIEYALVAALIAFGAVGTMGTLATDINQAFSTIGSKLVSAAG